MTRTFLTITIALGLLAALAGPLSAQQPPPPGQGQRQGFVERFDTDGDGKVSKEEFKGRPEMFDRLDADKDGYVTPEELKAMREQWGRDRGQQGGQQGGSQDRQGRERQRRGRQGQGQGRMPYVNPWMEALDKNKDGKIGKEEWTTGFAQLDTDGDGTISQKEFPRAKPPTPEKIIQVFDRNNDGKLSIEELPPHFKQQLGRADTDSNGVLSKEELSTAMTKAKERQGRDRQGRDRQGRDRQGAPNRQGDSDRQQRRPQDAAARVDNMFSRFDKDGDGLLSGDEIPERMKERFKDFDINDDGLISKDEMKSAMGDPKAKAKRDAPRYISDNDADGDGKLSRDEFPGDKTFFNTLDANKDNYISTDELVNARRQ